LTKTILDSKILFALQSVNFGGPIAQVVRAHA